MDMTKEPRTFLVRTSVGTTIHSEDKPVNTTYSNTKVSALKKGDFIFWNEESRNPQNVVRLLEGERIYGNALCDYHAINNILAKNNQEYAQARDVIQVDVGGKTFPRMGYELLKAAEKNGFIKSGKPLDKLLLEDGSNSLPLNDIATDIRDEFIFYLTTNEHTPLDDQGRMIEKRYSVSSTEDKTVRIKSQDRFKRWLHSYISPQDLEDLLVLSVALDHEPLMDIYDESSAQNRLDTMRTARSKKSELLSDVKNSTPASSWGLSYGQVLEAEPFEKELSRQ